MNKYDQNYGKQIAEQIAWQDEYEAEVRNADLMEWLFNQKKESK